MSGRQPDATAAGMSSAKKHRLSVLSQKHSSNKRRHVSSSTQAASKSSPGFENPKANLARTDANKKDEVIYSGLKRSQLCEQLQTVIPKAKHTAVIQDLAAEFLDSLMVNTEAAGTGAQAIQRNAKHSHLHLENPIVPTSARKKASRSKLALSRSVRKDLQRIPDQQKYDCFQPLHDLWRQQVSQALATGSSKQASVLRDIAWQGAAVRVSECANRNQVGQYGIILRITRNTVQMITPADQLLVVAKVKSTFYVKLNDRNSVVLRGQFMV